MVTLIDSSVWIVAAERGHLDLAPLVELEEVGLAAITASELLHGVHRAADARQRARREAFVERLLAEVPVLPFDVTAARIHSRIWAELAGRGVTIGAHDLQIAATALAAGGRVATRDERSFPLIPGLSVMRW